MKSLDQIKKEYAQEKGFKDWADLMFKDSGYYSRLGLESHMDEVSKIQANEAMDELRDKIIENVEVKVVEKYAGSIGNEFGQLYDKGFEIDESSILNTKIDLL